MELARAFAAVSGGGGATAARPQSGGLLGLFRRADRKPEPARAEDDWDREERIVREWSAGAQARDNPFRRTACRALARVASAVRAQHGRLWGDKSLLAPIALGIACNEQGTEAVGALIEPHIRRAAQPRATACSPPRSGRSS